METQLKILKLKKIGSIFKKINDRIKKNKEKISFTNRGLEAVKLYALFILPMLIFAAFLETYLAEILFVFFSIKSKRLS